MTEAKTERDARMLEAATQLQEAIAEAKAKLEASLVESAAILQKAREDAQKKLNEGLAEAQKVLQKALVDAQLAYQKAIDEISATTAQKLEALKAQLAAVAAATAALVSANAAYTAAATAPKVVSPLTTTTGINSKGGVGTTNYGPTIVTNISGTNLTDPSSTANSVVSAIKYGTAVTVNTTTLAGIQAASGSNFTSTGISNKLKGKVFE
jgi:membrane protein involved in colicin uptake